jgi:ketosteroid isomerase-like protein
MTLVERLHAYVALCEQGATLEAITQFYAPDVVVFENHERARHGRAACLAFERDALAKLPEPARLKAKACAVNAHSGITFIEWVIRFVGVDGRPMRLEEVAVQRWSGGQISEERFYYEGVIDEGDEDEPPSEHAAP